MTRGGSTDDQLQVSMVLQHRHHLLLPMVGMPAKTANYLELTFEQI